MVQKVTEQVMKALLEEVHNKENQFTETLQQFNNTYNSIATKIRVKVVE